MMKTTILEDAVARIPDGASLMIGGFMGVGTPERLMDELVRQGKSVNDARAGGSSGCVEVGAFGKENYNLTGYFNMPKILELTLHNGHDPRTGQPLGPATGEPGQFETFADFLAASIGTSTRKRILLPVFEPDRFLCGSSVT